MDLNALVADAQINISAHTAAAEKIIADNKKAIAEAKAAAKAEAPASKQATVAAPAIVEPAQVTVEGDLDVLMEQITDDEAVEVEIQLTEQFENRTQFELAKGASAQKIANLVSYERRLKTVAIATLLAATKVDLSFINRQQGANRYNVYAIDKFADLSAGLATGYMRNAVNIAIMKSMFACRKEGFAFTKELALAATSTSVRIDEKIRKVLTRHTVSDKTMDTQMSSTMSALEMLGVVENYGPRNSKVWRLTDTPQTRKMEKLMAA